MKKYAVSFCILVLSICLFVACESDDDKEEISNYETVVINDDGSTSDGSVYIPIDVNSFYLDGVEYTIEDSKLTVSGYNREVSPGEIRIPFAIKFRNVRYEVTQIADQAFEECCSLTSVTIPNSITTIGAGAFYWCRSLTSITIPNSVTSIGAYAFDGCSNLTSITIPNSITSIEYNSFAYCSNLTSVTIPNSVTNIGASAFYDCSNLKSVSFSNSVTTIENGAFSGCYKLISVTIGQHLKNIANTAFLHCDKLDNIYCYTEQVPHIDDCTLYFVAINDHVTLHVPAASVSSYQKAIPLKWFFKDIVALTDNDPKP